VVDISDVVRLGSAVEEDVLLLACDVAWDDDVDVGSDVDSGVLDEARGVLVVDGSDVELELDCCVEPVPVPAAD
jgi:hypothetical protein